MPAAAALAVSRARADKRTIVATAIIVWAGFALGLFAFWPGLMSIDSVVQYTQALLRQYHDQHPPVMAWLWSLTDRIIAGPGGMLIVHLALLWAGLWAIAEGARSRGLRYTWLIPLIGVLPTIANLAGVIWKDVGMAYALLCGGGVLYACERRTPIVRFGASALALLLIGYATMVRHNAAAATLALACYMVKVNFPRLSIARSIVGGAVLVAALMTTQQMIERVALNASRSHLSQIAMLFDVAGLVCGGADVDIPAAFKVPGYEPSALCRSYDPDQVDALFFFPASPLRTSLDDASLAALRRVWLDAIVEHPGLYVVHRSRAFMALLGLRDVPRPYVALTQPYMQPNPWGFTFEPNALSRTLDATVGALADHGVFNGALWVALALALLAAVAVGRLRAPFEVSLLASALMYVLPYFFLSLAPNYRFIYWSVLATSVAGALLALRAIGRAADYETVNRDVISVVDGA